MARIYLGTARGADGKSDTDPVIDGAGSTTSKTVEVSWLVGAVNSGRAVSYHDLERSLMAILTYAKNHKGTLFG